MTFDHELCVLFLYHRCDKLTLFHLESLRKSNPDALILPLTDAVHELLPGSIDVATLPPLCVEAQKWRSIDATLYRWFKNRTFNARKYVLAEYDCFCNVNLSDYYSEVSSADVAGVDFFTIHDNPQWRWFKADVERIPYEDRSHAAAIVPFTCTMFSHGALERIVANVYLNDIFCELRLGTLVNKLGLMFQRLSREKRGTLCWHEYPWQVNRPGFYHSIKSLNHNHGRRRQPGNVSTLAHDFLRSHTKDRKFLPALLHGKQAALVERLDLIRNRFR